MEREKTRYTLAKINGSNICQIQVRYETSKIELFFSRKFSCFSFDWKKETSKEKQVDAYVSFLSKDVLFDFHMKMFLTQ